MSYQALCEHRRMPARDPRRSPSDERPLRPRQRSLVERIADPFQISLREAMIALLPVVFLLMLVGYVTQRFVRPAPPSKVVMTVGNPGADHDEFAKRYQKILGRSGVTLELHRSSGVVENYDRLRAPVKPGEPSYDVGFIHSGIGSVDEAPHLDDRRLELRADLALLIAHRIPATSVRPARQAHRYRNPRQRPASSVAADARCSGRR